MNEQRFVETHPCQHFLHVATFEPVRGTHVEVGASDAFLKKQQLDASALENSRHYFRFFQEFCILIIRVF